ncbi:MAG: glutamate-5-semialdehyde dehydrogenase [Rhodospirillaceae bacterium]|jgi:glutamate-5-semialdehyde dehydrogenase|nr:glutamate-5-semialdehyde dehydrogenase [Rhodospirillaceae bacterium]MBT3885887.1 glutamate-5-semialdehyde dehydrogenase [Rhodospirillaceae bacterium]MBT4117871.1 glutamate-5-semialdehyde dehydrogenase [Rhodospirillaceae bacterium]MBT4672999.1 glutamate-5-semialdehyde dehydrogenase [Rhodospirillaceae bacterium]MBT4750165.1 glutamate-5-semialdehyde dehydrogenase [Rhodospirillaceae bacterium]
MTDNLENIPALMQDIGAAAKDAAGTLAGATAEAKNRALTEAANSLRANEAALLEANAKDMQAGADKGLTGPLLDRLALDAARIDAMATGIDQIAALDDPVGFVMDRWQRPNGLDISRVRVPLGVIGIIYESRPNVTADAGSLCLKSGNASILRGGSESFHSSTAILACMQEGLKLANLPAAAIQMVPTTDRAAVGEMLTMTDYIDVIVPRGGRSLVERVQTEAKVPVFAHLEGICHTYIDAGSDPDMARDIVLNAKMRRTSICGATETLLIDRRAAATHLPMILDALTGAGCEIRGDADSQALDGRIGAAKDEDWKAEYLDAVIAVKQVDGVEEAVRHINTHGSEHTDAIVTDDAEAAETFLNGVNSAIAMHNTSTQFADGGEFGMGAEIGISTGKMHARGPVGVEQLTTFKYVVRGSGQIRP